MVAGERAGEEEEAQAAPPQTDPATLDTVTVTGIRGSFMSSMNLKRDSAGRGRRHRRRGHRQISRYQPRRIPAAHQRRVHRPLAGRGFQGHRARRGTGLQSRAVERQADAGRLAGGRGAGVSNSRAFDFANLASEAISAIEVYKTARSDTPSGGIGATINIKTARPLDNPGLVANVGIKAVNDTTVDNLPRTFKGESVTPEISGIFSNTFADGRFGVALSASYQERDFGFSQASVANGWAKFRGDDTTSWNRLPQPGEPNSELITNRPGPNDVYSRPQNTGYSVNGVQRQRTNGQLVLQWAPTDRVTTTLDYTYSENKIQQQRSELSVWFNYQPGESTWTDGPVSAPTSYSEFTSGTADVAMGGAQFATKSENKSLGFNVEWEVNDSLDLEFDYHDSTAETMPDSPYGSAGVLAAAAFVRGTTTVDYSRPLPIVHMEFPNGGVEPSRALVTGSVFHNSYTKSEVEQGQIKGRFKFGDYSGLDFGVASTEVQNRTAYGYMQRDTWGGVGQPGDYDDDIWYADDMSRYFDSFSNHGDPRWSSRFLVFDFERLRQRAAQVGDADNPACPTCYVAPDEFTRDMRTTEKSKSAFLQWTTTWDWKVPIHAAVGVRYEKTDVESTALVPIGQTITWLSANEMVVNYGEAGFTRLEGDYAYWLPNLDLSADLSENMVLRASYGRTIGRPGWEQIQGGKTIANIVRVDGGDGSQGNPALKPLVSDNFDVSFEWYYGEASFVSLGYFRKNIDNYIGTSQVADTSFGLHTPVGGTYWNNAIAAGCPATDMVCIRNYIFRNHDGDPGVTHTGTNSNGEETGNIVGQPGDPVASFDITVPANQKSASLDGWEFNIQHMIEDTGFGIAANYTIVNSSLTYDNYNLGEQFALEGLSDSFNVVGFYDKDKWQIRLAYNWRDKFLSSRFDGQGPNPNYTEPYGQLDANISYQFNDHLSLSLEGINLTDETQRVHGRHVNQALWVTQNGPRYMFGLRYKF